MATLAKLHTFLETPMAKIMPSFLAATGFSFAAIYANKAIFNVAPNSLSPDFVAAAAEKEGIAERISAPAVFLNPIRRGINGGVRGPDDVATA
ncbi:hypothetical protein Rsub_07751 [Raphidocelis subcapitata]|uniref:Uncharacterized protein n=1 Tax=Raphidocelis subcapitata TaxID=307507 RepID=A0A2V0PBQ1_9CHLO|nr:hypothetical protein Rsub_07751 [Raphidocelis subcapitata]|eukprot:GBF95323.1 hypothetical protein Rsub_07751 [Raphidocelis subcapitata]